MKFNNKFSGFKFNLLNLMLAAVALLLSSQSHLIPYYSTNIAGVTTDSEFSEDLFEKWKASRSFEEFQEDKMFIHSIIKVAKNYYVDSQRVGNKELFLGTVAKLAEDPFIQIDYGPNYTILTSGTISIKLKIDDDVKDKQILEGFLKLAAFVDALEDKRSLNSILGYEKKSGVEYVLNEMLTMLDAHSSILSAESYKELKQGTEGAFGGLGVLVGIREKLLTVVKPLPRSPAQRVGITFKDIILSIDGNETFGYTIDHLVQFMRGEPGTEVSLKILRDKATHPRVVKLKREIIQVDSVEERPIKDHPGILNIAIDSFSSRTSGEVYNAIRTFKRNNNGVLGGLILDLRSNPGGLLDQAIQVADLFIDKGVIVATKGRREEVESAGRGYDSVDYPIIVLINSESASASEIVAGALQDHMRAVVIGQPSFGKGSVQTIFELPGERALKLTIARYYTPIGRSIQNTGIKPEIWLQPVVKYPENMNLLGNNHYKNEALLSHSLNAIVNPIKNKYNFTSVFKGYYLKDYDSEDDVSDNQAYDVELKMAIDIIKAVNDVYGDHVPESSMRSTHWLAIASKSIHQYVEEKTAEAQDWLVKNQKVDWKKENNSSQVTLTLGANAPTKAIPGDSISIPVVLQNKSETDIERVSVFLSSDTMWFLNNEKLIGKINKEKTKKLSLDFSIPTNWPQGVYKVNVTAAVDAEPLFESSKDLFLSIENRETPNLSATSLIEDESKTNDQKLENQEVATFRITLKNESPVAARDLTARLVNLSGIQTTIDNAIIKIPHIDPNSTRDLKFRIRSSPNLYTENINYGLIIESLTLKEDFVDNFSIKAIPNITISAEKDQLLGH